MIFSLSIQHLQTLCKVSILSRIAQALSEQAIKKTCQSYYFGSTFDLKPSHNKYIFF